MTESIGSLAQARAHARASSAAILSSPAKRSSPLPTSSCVVASPTMRAKSAPKPNPTTSLAIHEATLRKSITSVRIPAHYPTRIAAGLALSACPAHINTTSAVQRDPLERRKG